MTLIEQRDNYIQSEKNCLKNIELWQIYNNHYQQINNLKYCITGMISQTLMHLYHK